MVVQTMNEKEKRYAALAPLLAIAGIFIHPVASTLLPLVMFLVLHRQAKVDASTIALRAADLVFSAQLVIILANLFVGLLFNLVSISAQAAQTILLVINMTVLIYLMVSLSIAAVQAFRGQVYRHLVSFRLAERVLSAFRAWRNATSQS